MEAANLYQNTATYNTAQKQQLQGQLFVLRIMNNKAIPYPVALK